MKAKNTYVILQKLHLWEKDPAARFACERLVDVLIVEDPLPGMTDGQTDRRIDKRTEFSELSCVFCILDDLRSVVIPEAMRKNVAEQYNETMKEIDEETKALELESNQWRHSQTDDVLQTDRINELHVNIAWSNCKSVMETCYRILTMFLIRF